LRPGVKFHDGYPLTSATVGGALQRLLGAQVNVVVAGNTLVVKSDRPMPGLLVELARPAASVAARSPDGAIVGTGPFRVARFDAGRHLTLAAFEEHWGGRPFIDTIEIEMGRSTRDQFVDMQVGKADVIELAPNEMRTAAERGTKTWVSAPVELLALVFGPGHASDDARLREALALSIDRAAIHNVLLQRQGLVTGALLPQWLTGYAFLFPAAMDLPRARQLVSELPLADRTLPLAYDPADPQARILADRIAVNARDAGITLQVTNQPKSELRLARTRFSSLDAAVALAELSDARLPAGQTRPEATYNAERALLEGFRVVPLFHLPEAYGIGGKVKMWQRPGITRLGCLNLADIWLEPAP
jgi:peptide/nickel transport system substrate-binding protein